jgi:hypothetical protein
VTVRDVLGIKGKLSGAAVSAVRLSLAQVVFGSSISSARSLTKGQAKALIERTKELLGQEQLKTLFTFQLDRDPALADAKRELGK